MALLDVNGVRLRVESVGDGEPLVLVYGSWDDISVWGLVIDDLATSFRVITYDRRGHGGSEDGSRPGTRRDDEDDLATLIDMFAIAPVNVAANSFGSSIALGMTVRCPELVQTLCVHEPPLLGLVGDDPTVAAVGARASEVVEIIEAGELETGAKTFCDLALGPDVWDVMTTDERALMIAHARTFAEEQRDPDWATIDLDALALLPVPVVLTKGDQSPPFFGAVVDRLASTIPNAEVRTISGAGHIPHLTHPTEYVRVVTDAFVR